MNFGKNKIAKIGGLFFLSLWLLGNLFLYSGLAPVTGTGVSNWPLFLGITAGTFAIPYFTIAGIQKSITYFRDTE
ncbi:hypothetical protein AB2B38_010025 [Balneola sp. MJW-20]|uniref:hypothetical protein n=1 Tax=Gracilimonas aurantiaca TaxID=3234185 RepID=UPI0034658320